MPQGVIDFFAARKHEVLLVVDELAPKTPDPIIVKFADAHGLICVTWNRRHFRSLTSRRPPNNQLRYPNAGMIAFECPESRGADRLKKCHDLIIFEHGQRQTLRDKRLIVEVHAEYLKIW
ncbi:MAG TPA: hypothetical protein VN754_01040 [Candidatus Binataceae bacterium]|nr:hypothetical protein [Candidatus Binataceae bacterium]